ncbi:MAG: tellurite resistance TerB family protein [Gemmatimonadaceae bacterium]
MTPSEAEAIVAIATLAALADGNHDAEEQAAIAGVSASLGLSPETTQGATSGQLTVAELAARLTTPESRQAAYDAALSVCHRDGQPGPAEQTFLSGLASTLGISAANAVNPVAAVVPSITSGAAAPNDVDNHILDQAILTAAMELLPDRLANMAILPLQLRMVYGIGQKHGQKLDARQVADLAATFGIGAVAQVFERVVRRALGGLAGGLLGGMLGGAGGVAAGAGVTFASTYALGHAAEQYYAQNRSLSVVDMKTLFTRFQNEAKDMYPRVQDRIRQRASGTSLSSVMQSIRG